MSLKAIREALELARHALDKFMGDTDIDDDGSDEMRAMHAIAFALSALEEIERGAERVWWCGLTRGGRARDVETFAKCTGHDYAEHGCGWRLVIPDPEPRKE